MNKLEKSSEIFTSLTQSKDSYVLKVCLTRHVADWWFWVSASPEEWHGAVRGGNPKALESGLQIPAQPATPWAGFMTSPVLTFSWSKKNVYQCGMFVAVLYLVYSRHSVYYVSTKVRSDIYVSRVSALILAVRTVVRYKFVPTDPY